MNSRNFKIKAAFLLFVFALNTLVGFACSTIGVFHSLHHHSSASSAKHKHADQQHEHKHSGTHHDESKDDEEKKGNCCSNSVVALQKMDKSPVRTIEAPSVSFVTAFVLSYLSVSLREAIQENTFIPNHIRWRLPTTIQDLRIVIQSFQI